MTKEDALARLNAIIDDPKKTAIAPSDNGISISKGDYDTILKRASLNEKTAYFALCSLIEACTREIAKIVKEESKADFVDLLEKSDFEFLSKIAKHDFDKFDDDFIVSTDICMQNMLRLGNKLVVSTEMCATLHQMILSYSTHGYTKGPSKRLGTFYVKDVLNFVMKMAYAEFLRLLNAIAEDEKISILEILYRWQELPVASEYFRDVILHYHNTSSLAVELPRQREANVVRAILSRGENTSTKLPLTTIALGVFNKITEIEGYDEDELDVSWDFANHVE